MDNLTLDEKVTSASAAAAELEAEKHFFDKNQPHYPLGFSVHYRNPGHWDINATRCPGRLEAWQHVHPGGQYYDTDPSRERAFRIRGKPGAVSVIDERWNPHLGLNDKRRITMFRTVSAAMLWISEELMQEPGETEHD